MFTDDIVRLAQIVAEHRRITLATLSTYAANDGKVLGRLARGHTITTRRAAQVTQWLSDNWPEGAGWPPDIPRPEPAPDSSGAGAETAGLETDPVAAVRTARERMVAAMGESRWEVAMQAEGQALSIGTRLGRNGQIASPEALCLALGEPRYVYDQVLRAYADGRPREHKAPRRGSRTERMLTALVAAGDGRFASRRLRAA